MWAVVVIAIWYVAVGAVSCVVISLLIKACAWAEVREARELLEEPASVRARALLFVVFAWPAFWWGIIRNGFK